MAEPKAPRRLRTDEEKAQERLDIETRKVEKLEADEATHEEALRTVRAQLRAARRRRDYAASDPALSADEPLPADGAPETDD